MAWRFTPFIIPTAIAGILSAAIAVFAWRRRLMPGALPLVVLALAAAIWSLGYACELASATLASSIVWAKLQYLGIVAAPVAWLAFVIQYTNRDWWLTRHNLLLLALIPFTTLLLVATNEHHHLIWSTTYANPSGALSLLGVTHGAAFWVHTAYSYLCLLGGVVLLAGTLVRMQQLYRRQTLALVVSAIAPWSGNTLYVAGLSPWPSLDLTPFGFVLAGLAIAWSFKSFRLLDLAPVARSKVIESMDDAVLVLDWQNRIVDLNPAASRIIGRDAALAIGRPAARIFDRWPDLVARYRDVASARDEISLGDGADQRVFDLQVATVRHSHSQLAGRVVVMRDITQRKRAEAALLVQQQVSEAANRAKSEFVSVVAHELKTPMTAIKGYVDLLALGMAGPANDAQAAILGIISSNIDMMATLVSDLADIARVESGQLHMEQSAVALVEVVDAALRALRRQIEAKAQTLLLNFPPELPLVWADRMRLIQIIVNLLSNASKYTPHGGQITIRAAYQAHAPAGAAPGEVCVTVQDNGIGISPEDQQKIFQKFFRSPDERARAAPGTGLGLNITKYLVELHGGRIWFESALRHGTTFHFTLPAIFPSLGARSSTEIARGAAASPPHDHANSVHRR